MVMMQLLASAHVLAAAVQPQGGHEGEAAAADRLLYTEEAIDDIDAALAGELLHAGQQAEEGAEEEEFDDDMRRALDEARGLAEEARGLADLQDSLGEIGDQQEDGARLLCSRRWILR